MIAAVLALTLAAEPPPVNPPSSPPAPAEDSLAHAQEAYDHALQLYAQTCDARAYGAYDDLCDQLKTQVHRYRVELDKAERASAAAPGKAPAPKP
jgi:hypothetical protein